mmetsp:Transcript_126321/g.252403  ORF Transcript_126321/g.252403 Transcript_126321/m.252403 type:complete len:242 (-) Transcript_126321:34-759(-)
MSQCVATFSVTPAFSVGGVMGKTHVQHVANPLRTMRCVRRLNIPDGLEGRKGGGGRGPCLSVNFCQMMGSTSAFAAFNLVWQWDPGGIFMPSSCVSRRLAGRGRRGIRRSVSMRPGLGMHGSQVLQTTSMMISSMAIWTSCATSTQSCRTQRSKTSTMTRCRRTLTSLGAIVATGVEGARRCRKLWDPCMQQLGIASSCRFFANCCAGLGCVPKLSLVVAWAWAVCSSTCVTSRPCAQVFS